MFDIFTTSSSVSDTIATADENYLNFLQNIKTFRKAKHMNQAQFAEILGVTQSFECRQEHGLHPFNHKQCHIIHKLINMDILFTIPNISPEFFLEQEATPYYSQNEILDYINDMSKYFNGLKNIPFHNLSPKQESEKDFLLSILKQWYNLGPGFSKYTYFKRAFHSRLKPYGSTLGIRSERFRLIELGLCKADSKFLFYCYHNCHCRPSFFLDNKPLLDTIYILLWQFISKDTRDFFANHMQDIISYEKYFNCNSLDQNPGSD